jgi:outer membrane protein
MKRSWIVLLLLFSVGSLAAQDKLTVEQAIALALNKNFDIQLAQNAAEAAGINDKYAIGAFLPTVNASASIVRNANQQEVAYSGVRDTLNSEGRG